MRGFGLLRWARRAGREGARAAEAPPRARVLRQVAVALGGAALLLVVASPPASAHAVLTGAEPADGAALDASPGEVSVQFNEPVDVPPQALRVLDEDGERVDRGDAGHGAQPSTVVASVPDDLPEGVYLVSWRVVSADAHPVRGTHVFTVGDADPEGAVAADLVDAGGTPSAALAVLARWLVYAGALLAAGGVAFQLFVHDGRPEEARLARRVILGAAAVAALATVVGVPLQAAETTGLGLAAVTDPAALGGVLDGPIGTSAAVRLAGLALLAAGAAALAMAWAPPVALMGALVALGSFLFAGHTTTSEPRVLVLAADAVHAAAAAVWFGGLVLLGITLALREPDAEGGARLVARFSTLALVSVVALAGAGLALAWVEVRALEALLTTAYGWTLAAKVALVGGVVALALYNRRRLVPTIRGRPAGAWRALRRTVRLEAAGVVAVLALTAVLVSLVPARVSAGIGEPFSAYADLGAEHEVHLVVDPAQPGENEVHVYLLDESGRWTDLGDDVTVSFAYPEAGVEPIVREPQRAGPGHWLHVGPEMAIPGEWRLRVDVDDLDDGSAEFDVAL